MSSDFRPKGHSFQQLFWRQNRLNACRINCKRWKDRANAGEMLATVHRDVRHDVCLMFFSHAPSLLSSLLELSVLFSVCACCSTVVCVTRVYCAVGYLCSCLSFSFFCRRFFFFFFFPYCCYYCCCCCCCWCSSRATEKKHRINFDWMTMTWRWRRWEERETTTRREEENDCKCYTRYVYYVMLHTLTHKRHVYE